MLRVFIMSVVFFLSAVSSAYACSCGGEPIKVSDFLKDKTVVYGTPRKTEWIRGNVPNSAVDINDIDWSVSLKQTKTTLIDVGHVSGQKQRELSFYHWSLEASCGVTPAMGFKDWFVLSEDDEGDLLSDLCMATRMPIGAILDYQQNGNDPVVPDGRFCRNFFNKHDKNETAINWAENCEFWDDNNQRRLRKIVREFQFTRW